MDSFTHRRNVLGLGAVLAAGALLDPHKAAAQAASESVLRTALDRGKLIVGTGSTNPPWHFEDDKGNLTGMDIAMARILAKGLFDDDTKVDYVRQDPAARVPNVTTGKVDIVIQFMTRRNWSPPGLQSTPRSLRTSMPMTSFIGCCRRRRFCSSTARPMSSRRSRRAVPMSLSSTPRQ